LNDSVTEREFAYYENLYGTFGIRHFSRPAVVAFRRYLVNRIRRRLKPKARILSIGCGIGDTELLLAPYAAHITGVDLSPMAIAAARRAAGRQGVTNVDFQEGSWQDLDLQGRMFDAVLAIFFLHHLPDEQIDEMPRQLLGVLREGGLLYALEPSERRLSGRIGKLVVPKLMKRYQTDDERQLSPQWTAQPFLRAGYRVATPWFDFCSTPLAGLVPDWKFGYGVARALDDVLTVIPGLRALSSNFELIAYRPPRPSEDGGTTPFSRMYTDI
jgi:ubiquinone/menaquinone biosynthesis C-methylase UbiE